MQKRENTRTLNTEGCGTQREEDPQRGRKYTQEKDGQDLAIVRTWGAALLHPYTEATWLGRSGRGGFGRSTLR